MNFTRTRIEEHVKKDNKSHILKHLHSTATCFDSYNSLSFKIIDKANCKFDLKIKKALHINWRKPKRPKKSFISHLFAISFVSLVNFFFIFFFFAFLFHLWFSLSLILIIGIFYCLNYTLPLCYFISSQHTLYHTFLFHLLFSVSLR